MARSYSEQSIDSFLEITRHQSLHKSKLASTSKACPKVSLIDLIEYSTNIRDSGLHGALLVLDPHFTPDNVANALGIPINKATVRRHLAAELDPLLAHARYVWSCAGFGPV